MRFLLLLAVVLAGTLPAFAQEADSAATAFRIYTADGTPATLDDVFAAMGTAEVVFVGEEHDDPVAHALQARLLEAAHTQYGADRPVALSLEMFERDVQYIVDEYLADLITEKHFRASARPWDNYETDYRPMVEYAKANGLPVIAANTPRRYVNRVTRLGPDALAPLSDQAKATLPPLPYAPASPAYKAKWDSLMAAAMAEMAAEMAAQDAAKAKPAAYPHAVPDTSAMHDEHEAHEAMDGEHEMMGDHVMTDSMRQAHHPGADSAAYAKMHAEHHADDADADAMTHDTATHETMTHDAMTHDAPDSSAAPAMPSAHGSGMGGPMFLIEAQSLWDAGMAYSIATHLGAQPGALVVHMVGGFHVEKKTGTPEQLRAYRPGTRSLVVAIRAHDDLGDFDATRFGGLGDFVILTDESLPRTMHASQ